MSDAASLAERTRRALAFLPRPGEIPSLSAEESAAARIATCWIAREEPRELALRPAPDPERIARFHARVLGERRPRVVALPPARSASAPLAPAGLASAAVAPARPTDSPLMPTSEHNAESVSGVS